MPHAGVQTLKVQGAGKMGEDTKGSHSVKGAGLRPPKNTGAGVLLGEHSFASCGWAAPLQPTAPAGTQESDHPHTRPIHVLRPH